MDTPKSAPVDSLAVQTSPSSLQWDGSIPTYSQLLDELEKPEAFTLSAWAARHHTSAHTKAHQPPTGSSQAPCVPTARELDAQSATFKTLDARMPAPELPLSDSLAASQAAAASQGWLSAATETNVSRSGQPQAAQHVATGGSQQKQQPAQRPESAVHGVTLSKHLGQNGRWPAEQMQKRIFGVQLITQKAKQIPQASTEDCQQENSGLPSQLISQPAANTAEPAVKTKRPLRLCLRSLQPHSLGKAFSIEPKEEPVSAGSCLLSSSEQDPGKDQLGGATAHPHGPLRERSSVPLQGASRLSAGRARDQPCQRSAGMSSRALEHCDSKHTVVAEMQVQSKEELGNPSLVSADPDISLSSKMQDQQRERRQFRASDEEAASDLGTQLWRRKQSRRNGVQYLWDKATQMKASSDIGTVKVEQWLHKSW